MLKLREITGLSQSEAEVAGALHDTQGVVERALDILMEVGQDRSCTLGGPVNSNSQTLLHKDCSLGSIRNLTATDE